MGHVIDSGAGGSAIREIPFASPDDIRRSGLYRDEAQLRALRALIRDPRGVDREGMDQDAPGMLDIAAMEGQRARGDGRGAAGQGYSLAGLEQLAAGGQNNVDRGALVQASNAAGMQQAGAIQGIQGSAQARQGNALGGRLAALQQFYGTMGAGATAAEGQAQQRQLGAMREQGQLSLAKRGQGFAESQSRAQAANRDARFNTSTLRGKQQRNVDADIRLQEEEAGVYTGMAENAEQEADSWRKNTQETEDALITAVTG